MRFGPALVCVLLLSGPAAAEELPPLHQAVAEGRAADVLMAVGMFGSDVNERAPDGRTPLMVAAAEGHVDLARSLIGFEAGLDLADGNGWTALHHAAAAGQAAIVAHLLEAGADPGVAAGDGATPLDVATGEARAALE